MNEQFRRWRLTALAGFALTAACANDVTDARVMTHVSYLEPSGAIVGLAGKCLEARGGSSMNGTRVQISSCDGSAGQKWTLSNGQILGLGGKCLDVEGNTSASGTSAILWDCWGGPNQQWSLMGHAILGIGAKCLDVTGENSENGTPVIIWDCWDGPNQQWTFQAQGTASTAPGGHESTPAAPQSPPPSSGQGAGNAQALEPVDPNAYVVATSGDDANAGSVVAPFATLERARDAMRASGVKTTYVRGGTYHRSSPLSLSSADDGTKWAYYPPDGVNSAILDGADSVDRIVEILGGSNITIDGLKIQHFVTFGVMGEGGVGNATASGNTVMNCDIGFNTVTTWNAGCAYFFNDVPNTTYKNNYCHDVGSMGLAINVWEHVSGGYDGAVIANNVILRAGQRKSDSGAIYLEDHNNLDPNPANHPWHATIANNFIRDHGSPNAWGTEGIYLDEEASNVTISGNVVGAPVPDAGRGTWQEEADYGVNNICAFMVHRGLNNKIVGNIVDLGSGGQVSIVSFASGNASGQPGSEFRNNVVVANFAGDPQTSISGITGHWFYEWDAQASWFTIRDNLYWNYGGGASLPNAYGPTNDANPTHEDPRMSGSTYQLAASSPALSSPVSLPPIAGAWGPPGFVVPSSSNRSVP